MQQLREKLPAVYTARSLSWSFSRRKNDFREERNVI